MELLSRIVGGVTGATLVSAIVVIWAAVKCCNDRSKNKERKSDVSIAFLGVLGVILTIGAELAAQDASLKAGGDLLESRERVVELLATIREINSRATYRSETLAPEWSKKFAAVLAKCPPNSIGLVRYDEDQESREFGDTIEWLLRSTGRFSRSGTVKVGKMLPRQRGRVTIQGHLGKQSAEAVESMAAVLRDAGITDVVAEPNPGIIIGVNGSFAQITIKPK